MVDVGCGAGNYTLKLLEKLPGLDAMLIDLSPRMIERATGSVSAATAGSVKSLIGDIRELPLEHESTDIILAAAVLHHLRTDAEWEAVFSKFYRALRPGGSIWIADMVAHDIPGVAGVMWERYGDYLSSQGGDAYRDKVFAYIDEEDTPQSLVFQTRLLGKVGFRYVEILHKNTCFAAFGAMK